MLQYCTMEKIPEEVNFLSPPAEMCIFQKCAYSMYEHIHMRIVDRETYDKSVLLADADNESSMMMLTTNTTNRKFTPTTASNGRWTPVRSRFKNALFFKKFSVLHGESSAKLFCFQPSWVGSVQVRAGLPYIAHHGLGDDFQPRRKAFCQKFSAGGQKNATLKKKRKLHFFSFSSLVHGFEHFLGMPSDGPIYEKLSKRLSQIPHSETAQHGILHKTGSFNISTLPVDGRQLCCISTSPGR